MATLSTVTCITAPTPMAITIDTVTYVASGAEMTRIPRAGVLFAPARVLEMKVPNASLDAWVVATDSLIAAPVTLIVTSLSLGVMMTARVVPATPIVPLLPSPRMVLGSDRMAALSLRLLAPANDWTR